MATALSAIATVAMSATPAPTAGAAPVKHARPAYKRDVPKALAAEAKITEAAALTTALAKVPKGHVVALELEKEDGKLIYSLEIKVAGKSGVEEVNVDALDGSVLAVEHETPKQEAHEKKADAAEKATAPEKKP